VTTCRVLIVDDQPVIRHALRTYLDRDARFTVVGEAGTARQAIDLAATEQLDAVLLDQNMPHATGLQILPVLRELQPTARIVMLTYENDIDEEAARALGADTVITKDLPLDIVATHLLPPPRVIDLVERDPVASSERLDISGDPAG
jgi:DNA-binding NarL/FixJ family response regulator